MNGNINTTPTAFELGKARLKKIRYSKCCMDFTYCPNGIRLTLGIVGMAMASFTRCANIAWILLVPFNM